MGTTQHFMSCEADYKLPRSSVKQNKNAEALVVSRDPWLVLGTLFRTGTWQELAGGLGCFVPCPSPEAALWLVCARWHRVAGSPVQTSRSSGPARLQSRMRAAWSHESASRIKGPTCPFHRASDSSAFGETAVPPAWSFEGTGFGQIQQSSISGLKTLAFQGSEADSAPRTSMAAGGGGAATPQV